jgi:hypothetical protein
MSDPTIPPFSCHFSLFLISPELKQKGRRFSVVLFRPRHAAHCLLVG